ncbi:DUF1120 domain-containing protein [Pseudomonas palleroniana]|uniref:DUF1120 domain-containing protein n=1 Tax=Pseudomonas palleroniana TaxID=191390 RepID=UPI003AFF96E9
MKASFAALAGSVLLVTCPWALAASSVDLTVKGSITPSACVPTLSQDGTVDYGKIASKDLLVDNSTKLTPVTLQLNVSCEAATLFALNGKDNRLGSAHFFLDHNYGLGLINGNEKLGSYSIDLLNPVSEVAVYPLFSSDQGQSWLMNSSGSYMGHRYWNAFSDTLGSGPHFPTALRSVTVDLSITTHIAPTRTLTLNEEVPLDGSASLDVLYL